MVQDHFCKNAFLTHFGPIFGPKTAHFQGILGFSMAQNAPPRPKNTCLSIPSGLGTTLEKMIFFCPGDPGGPTVGPRRARAGLPSGSTK